MTPQCLAVLPRSFLYVPADQPKLFDKAVNGPADALIFDLEDAVPPARKDQARAALGEWLSRENAYKPHRARAPQRPQYWVRISAEDTAADLRSVVTVELAGVFLAKCTPANLRSTSELLDELELARHLTPESIPIIGLIEGADALLQLEKMATHRRLLTFAVGEVDLMADLRMARGPLSEPALDALRIRIVLGCAAATLLPPVAPTSTAIRALDDFVESSRKLQALGFRSRTAIHPSQLSVIHDVFTPSAGEVEAARDVMERFRQAGGGVAVDQRGRMIDAAVVRSAEETLQRAITNR